MTRGITHTIRKNLKLENMLFDYGLKLNENLVVDVQCAPKIVPYAEQTLLPWFFHVMASPTSHPVSRNIEPVSLEYANETGKPLDPNDRHIITHLDHGNTGHFERMKKIIILFVFIGNIIIEGAHRINWDFLTALPSRRPERAGIYTAMMGTVWILLLTTIISFPIGVGAGIYLEEYSMGSRLYYCFFTNGNVIYSMVMVNEY